jgi:hypothetical protein
VSNAVKRHAESIPLRIAAYARSTGECEPMSRGGNCSPRIGRAVLSKIVGVVIGDPGGVGPEVCVKALATGDPPIQR